MEILNSRVHLNALGPAYAKEKVMFFWSHLKSEWYDLVFDQVDFVWKTSAARQLDPNVTGLFLKEFFTPRGLFGCKTLVDIARRLAIKWGIKAVWSKGNRLMRRTTRKKAGGANVAQIRRLVKE